MSIPIVFQLQTVLRGLSAALGMVQRRPSGACARRRCQDDQTCLQVNEGQEPDDLCGGCSLDLAYDLIENSKTVFESNGIDEWKGCGDSICPACGDDAEE